MTQELLRELGQMRDSQICVWDLPLSCSRLEKGDEDRETIKRENRPHIGGP